MEAEFTSPKARKMKAKGSGRLSTRKRTREVSEEKIDVENNESDDVDDGSCDTVRRLLPRPTVQQVPLTGAGSGKGHKP